MADDTYPYRKNIRLPAFRYEQSEVVSLTICTADRNPLFVRDDLCELLVSHLKNISSDMKMNLLCYVVMPDHMHVLLESSGKESIVEWVRRLKGRFSREAGKQGVVNPVWQRSFFDHFLREDEQPLKTVQYILENPQRTGLVDQWWKYPWSWDFMEYKEKAKEKTRED